MSNTRKITIPLNIVDEGLSLVGSNIRIFIQDHYALMQAGSTWHAVAMSIFALEELVKYHELKRQKEVVVRQHLSSVEVDERIFGYGGKSHEYKLKTAKEKELIPSEAWTINTARYGTGAYGSAQYGTEDVIIAAALRMANWYVDWRDGKWQIGTEALETSRLKNFADSIIIALEKLARN